MKEKLENAISAMSDEDYREYINTFDEDASLEVKDGLVKIRKYNKKLIDDLKMRAGYCCQICRSSSMNDYGVSIVEGHHIESFSLTQNNKPENIMILCPDHHRLIHQAKGIFNKSNLTIEYASGKVDTIAIPLHLQRADTSKSNIVT
ncbi:HNH endonuclease [Paenibacillus sp. IHBB 3054]|uniref:HNH endonuclease n=1 Tax=Paenibacillus sp. IHBB 3054 TaxID=3425689 RepID=UPI003F67F505